LPLDIMAHLSESFQSILHKTQETRVIYPTGGVLRGASRRRFRACVGGARGGARAAQTRLPRLFSAIVACPAACARARRAGVIAGVGGA
jgi:hypothetical protein